MFDRKAQVSLDEHRASCSSLIGEEARLHLYRDEKWSTNSMQAWSLSRSTMVPVSLGRPDDGGAGGYRIDGRRKSRGDVGGEAERGWRWRGARMNSNVKQKHRVTNGVYSRRHCFKWLSGARNLSRFATWQAPLNLFIHPRKHGFTKERNTLRKR